MRRKRTGHHSYAIKARIVERPDVDTTDRPDEYEEEIDREYHLHRDFQPTRI